MFNPYRTLVDNLYHKPEKYDFLGFKLNSLFGMGACPSTGNSNGIRAAFQNGFDIVTYKTQRNIRFPANPYPNVLQVNIEGDYLSPDKFNDPVTGIIPHDLDPTNLTIANSCGINCEGPDFWIKDMQKAISYADEGQLMIMSVVGTIKNDSTAEEYYEDFSKTAAIAVKAGAKVIEVNLACPNVASEPVVCYSPTAVKKVCQKVRKQIGDSIPLIAKIGYFKTNQEQLLKEVVEVMLPHVNAINSINTIAVPIVDMKGEQAFPGPGRQKAGVSGSKIKWAGIEMASRLNDLRSSLNADYSIIGMGGVLKPADYEDYKNVGADAVQSSTGAMWNPELAIQIKQYLNAPYIKT